MGIGKSRGSVARKERGTGKWGSVAWLKVQEEPGELLSIPSIEVGPGRAEGGRQGPK